MINTFPFHIQSIYAHLKEFNKSSQTQKLEDLSRRFGSSKKEIREENAITTDTTSEIARAKSIQ